VDRFGSKLDNFLGKEESQLGLTGKIRNPYVDMESSASTDWCQRIGRGLLGRPVGGICASGCVVECRICNREHTGTNLGQGYFAPRSTQPSIPPGR